MAQRVAAIFHNRNDAERAADALAELGADRGQISMLARGEEGKGTTSWPAARPGATAPAAERVDADDMVEPAREVGDSGAPLTTTDAGEATKGAAIGAAAGLAAGLLALTVPGIGFIFALGPLALAMAGGAIAGGVYGALKDLGIEEGRARGYEERIRHGDVLMTAVLPTTVSEDRALDVLARHGAEDVSFAEDRQASRMPSSAAAVGASATPPRGTAATGTDRDTRTTDRTVQAGTGEIRVPVTEETAEVRKVQREAGQVAVTKEVDVETKHISEPVTETTVVAETREVPAGEQYHLDPNATTLREGETLRVPVVKEELKVEKVPKVTGEVVIRTEQETRQVEQDVQLRRERVEVEEEGDVEVERTGDIQRRKP